VVNTLLTAAGYARYRLTRGETLDERIVRRRVDQDVLRRPPPAGNNLAILVPMRDVEQHVTRLVELIASLEHPREQTKLVFLEGDSTDETYERLEAALAPLRGTYRDIIVARKHLGTTIERKERWEPQHQRVRRSAIAKVRNHLIDIGLDASDDWALWIDADMWWFPQDLFAQLRAANARITVPDCTTLPGGITFDANTWLEFERPPAYRFYRRINRGVYQPFGGGRARERLYLDSLRHTDRVEVDSVGGTVLLVDAALHRGGLRFPEVPYRHHLETEGFGLLARDLGVRPVALPRLEVLHVPIQW
jgi:glycosyltransferase involved in cell wall biosynthesis